MQYTLLREHPLEIIPDHKARSVRIRQNHQSPALRRQTQQRHKLSVFHHAKAGSLKNRRIDQLAQGVFVIPSFHNDRLLQLNHGVPPPKARG